MAVNAGATTVCHRNRTVPLRMLKAITSGARTATATIANMIRAAREIALNAGTRTFFHSHRAAVATACTATVRAVNTGCSTEFHTNRTTVLMPFHAPTTASWNQVTWLYARMTATTKAVIPVMTRTIGFASRAAFTAQIATDRTVKAIAMAWISPGLSMPMNRSSSSSPPSTPGPSGARDATTCPIVCASCVNVFSTRGALACTYAMNLANPLLVPRFLPQFANDAVIRTMNARIFGAYGRNAFTTPARPVATFPAAVPRPVIDTPVREVMFFLSCCQNGDFAAACTFTSSPSTAPAAFRTTGVRPGSADLTRLIPRVNSGSTAGWRFFVQPLNAVWSPFQDFSRSRSAGDRAAREAASLSFAAFACAAVPFAACCAACCAFSALDTSEIAGTATAARPTNPAPAAASGPARDRMPTPSVAPIGMAARPARPIDTAVIEPPRAVNPAAALRTLTLTVASSLSR